MARRICPNRSSWYDTLAPVEYDQRLGGLTPGCSSCKPDTWPKVGDAFTPMLGCCCAWDSCTAACARSRLALATRRSVLADRALSIRPSSTGSLYRRHQCPATGSC
ncbi:hypothetical protein D3C77_552390 [compost metagenome]